MAQGNAGKGRPKGSKNKVSAAVKDMIGQALEAAHPGGAVAFLGKQAQEEPRAFLALLGRTLRLKVKVSGGPLTISVVAFADRLAHARERASSAAEPPPRERAPSPACPGRIDCEQCQSLVRRMGRGFSSRITAISIRATVARIHFPGDQPAS